MKDKRLWEIFWESSLFSYGIGSTRFKTPFTWAFMSKIDELIGCAEGKLVLDVGCGPGVKALLLALKGAKVRGFDIDPLAIRNSIRNMQKLGKKIDAEFYIWDVQKSLLEYRSAVDFILCNQVIEHIENPRKAIKNMIDTLKPGGRIFITTPNRLTHKLRRGERVYGQKKHRHLHAFSRDDLKKMVGNIEGVEIEEITTHLPPFSFWIGGVYRIYAMFDMLQRLIQKIDENRGTKLERLFVKITEPFVRFCNAFVYPSLLSSYIENETKMGEDSGNIVYLVLKKLEKSKIHSSLT